mmetsp:Transcript_62248/g.124779  ORF Transcript_62248/g.124779 Transcript_62248/m.124779 type:complete len:215 (-) Transcript_62248:47-691(-)
MIEQTRMRPTILFLALAAVSADLATPKNETKVGDGNVCTTAADCESFELCVEISPTYSQCVDCTNYQFECGYWDTDTLQAMSQACDMNCASAKCDNTTAPCYGGDTCVTEEDGSWSQCVDCTTSVFQADCVKWDSDLRQAAVESCEVNCLNVQCTADASGMECLAPYQCVTQADQNWSQCVDCTNTDEFDYNCYSWTNSFKVAAEAACDMQCPT